MAERAAVTAESGTHPPVRVGVDMTAVGEVAGAVATFGERYMQRLFTPQEVDSCRGPGAAASLAARFAAKEAVVKVLEPSGARPPWRDIEVVRQPSGACRIRLHRTAASLAAKRGIGPMSVSLSHEAGLAVAVVAAWSPPAGPERGNAHPAEATVPDPTATGGAQQ